MADYYGKARTNYFRVKDEERLADICKAIQCDDDSIHLCSDIDRDGVKRFMFWCDSSIQGCYPSDDEEVKYDIYFDVFMSQLQEVLADDDAIIITEIGSEAMRYLVGMVVVITKDDVYSEDLDNIGKSLAREKLRNPKSITHHLKGSGLAERKDCKPD